MMDFSRHLYVLRYKIALLKHRLKLQKKEIIKHYLSLNYSLPLPPIFKGKKIQLAILTAGIQYLALHKEISPVCGIDFNDLPIEELREALQVVISNGLDQR